MPRVRTAPARKARDEGERDERHAPIGAPLGVASVTAAQHPELRARERIHCLGLFRFLAAASAAAS